MSEKAGVAARIAEAAERYRCANPRWLLGEGEELTVAVEPRSGGALYLVELGGLQDELESLLAPERVMVRLAGQLPAEEQSELRELAALDAELEFIARRRQLAAFAGTAREFVAWADAPLCPQATSKSVFAELRRQLVLLYAAALALPEPPDDVAAKPEPLSSRPERPVGPMHFLSKIDLLGIRRYAYAFRPTVDADVLTDGDLADDLLSVRAWIAGGFKLFEAGQAGKAWWDWWWDLDGHAGHHLANALYVLQAEAVYGDRRLGRND